MALATSWTEGQAEKLTTLCVDPERPILETVKDQLNSECGTTYTLRAVTSKLERLGIKPKLPGNWDEIRIQRVTELYLRDDAPSCQVIAEAMNAEFGTRFTRCAIIGKISRLKLANRGLPIGRTVAPRKPQLVVVTEVVKALPPKDPQRAERLLRVAKETPATISLRCVEIVPRHLSLLDLEPRDCRYPYGGDAINEPITFCGHPAMPDRSYCVPHNHLTRGPGTFSERAATQGVA